ncbi:SpoIIAA family protein [Rhodoflexus caldus]|uniref:STAS/SEC14 domain-containing protein n=1 Tax=Rhodoflexus caldus TaxID=2891236 RepID=UPI002029E88F|nr:STAS/SEC14 domain-containing protein [Rhodoflexus caldus]
MQPIEELSFIKMYFDEADKIMISCWKEGNGEITEADLRHNIAQVADLIQTHRPKYFLADDSNRQFIYEVHMQDWVAQTLATACISVGLKKYALIFPQGLIAQLSTELTVDAAGVIPSVGIRYFDSRQAALCWFKQ